MRRLALVAIGVALMACATSSLYTGKVLVTGSAPRNIKLVLATEETQYQIVGELVDVLWEYQGMEVAVHGTVVGEAYGPGFPAQLEVESIETPVPPRLRSGPAPGDARPLPP